MAYSADSFVADEQPTTAKWNKLWNNDASFNDGSGIASMTWATTALANPYKFRASNTAAQNTSAGTHVKTTYNTEQYDTNSNYDSATNYRYTAPVAGFFNAVASFCVTANPGSFLICVLYKNGAALQRGIQAAGFNGASGANYSDQIQLAATDYIEGYNFASNTVALGVSAPEIGLFGASLFSRT